MKTAMRENILTWSMRYLMMLVKQSEDDYESQ